MQPDRLRAVVVQTENGFSSVLRLTSSAIISGLQER